MLVLTRRTNQSIIIGDGIEVTILGIAGEKVRLGISAPEDVGVYRQEVYARIAAGENGGISREGSPQRGQGAKQ